MSLTTSVGTRSHPVLGRQRLQDASGQSNLRRIRQLASQHARREQQEASIVVYPSHTRRPGAIARVRFSRAVAARALIKLKSERLASRTEANRSLLLLGLPDLKHLITSPISRFHFSYSVVVLMTAHREKPFARHITMICRHSLPASLPPATRVGDATPPHLPANFRARHGNTRVGY